MIVQDRRNGLACEVLVAGGGPGGLAAAVSAARNGADTLLIERYGFLGGMATAGLVNPFMTYFAGNEQIIDGVFAEIIDRLDRAGAYNSPRCRTAFDPEVFKVVADEICLESGVRLLLHATVTGCTVAESLIREVSVLARPDERRAAAQVYVDATGDADLAFAAGVDCGKGREEDGLTQPMTLNFRMSGCDVDRVPLREAITELYLKARNEGRIDCPRGDVLFFFTTRADEVHFNTTRVTRADGTSAEDLTRAEIESRRQMMQIVDFLRAEVDGFENAALQVTAAQIGVRESRRIVGEYVLTAGDVLQARKFDDVIARGSYPVDIHDPDGGGTVIRRLPAGESYDIPYRCLVPLKVDNLLVAGRPISATHEAHSSLRVMPIAMAIGEAAGAAAALCALEATVPRRLDSSRLQQVLVNQGANLGAAREGARAKAE